MIQWVRAFQDNYIWLIIHHDNTTFSCVDPGDADPVLAFAKQHQLSLYSILLTHHHADHTGGVEKLLDVFPNVVIYGPTDDRIPWINQPVTPAHPIPCKESLFTILPTPGHTSTHICYYEAEHPLLFCGDTLFSAGCGRVFDGTIEALYASFQTLQTLPLATEIYCAHEYTKDNLAFAAWVDPENEVVADYLQRLLENPLQCSLPSTLSLEKQINPFMRAQNGQLTYFAKQHHLNPDDTFVIFKQLREEKNTFKASTTFHSVKRELQTGWIK